MNLKNLALTGLGACALLASCAGGNKAATEATTASGLNPELFSATKDGKDIKLYTLRNAAGTEACVTNFGGRLVSLAVADKNGKLTDVVLGFDSIQDYIEVPSDFGASIGRYANRIGQGRFVLDGDTVKLPTNNFGHCLHGGPTGWQYAVYDVAEANDSSIVLTFLSPDGDNNFPGNVKAKVTYTLTADNKLDIAYEATTDKPTVVNMTNHSYFNLGGDPSKAITDHLLTVNAESYTPVDSTFMTTGEIATVEGTPFDFRTAKPVGQDIDADNEQVRNGKGFDHNWVLATNGSIDVPAAVLYSPETGIEMTVYTTEPGVQVYTGNFLDGTVSGKGGKTYGKRAAICLETQHYPDSPNKADWPSTVLRPGETYKSHTIYSFDIKK